MKVRILNAESRFREDDPIENIEKAVFLNTGMVQLWFKNATKPPYSIQVDEKRIIEIAESEHGKKEGE